jgi:hypothetical protein
VGLADERGVTADVPKGALLPLGLLEGMEREDGSEESSKVLEGIMEREDGSEDGPKDTEGVQDGSSDSDALGELDERDGRTDGSSDGDLVALSDGDPLGGLDEPEGPADGSQDGSPDTQGTRDSDGDPLGGLDAPVTVRYTRAAAACTSPYPYWWSLPSTPRSSAVWTSAARTSLAVLVVLWLQIKAATPATWGHAMLVPLLYPYLPRILMGMVERTLTPGAAIST